MLLMVFAVNSVLVCSVASLAQCAEGGSTPYISEVMLLCKRGGHAFVPWLCFFAFAAMVLVQLAWMERAATAWLREQALCGRLVGLGTSAEVWVDAKDGSRTLFVWLAVATVVGFGFVVRFDWRDAGDVEKWMHRLGVALLAFGGFGALQVVWLTLRQGDCVARLRGAVVSRDVPWLSWVEVDVLFVAVLGVFMVTTLVGGHAGVSAVFEYVAFALLLGQTTWLFVLCWERDAWTGAARTRGMRGAEGGGTRRTEERGAEERAVERHEAGTQVVEIHGGTGLLWALLATYAAEVGVVLLVVL
jgi:hypothetical protein